MRRLTLIQGTYYDRETDSYEHVEWFEFGDTIYEGIMFLVDYKYYENTIEDPAELEEDSRIYLGMFDPDEADDYVHEHVCRQ